MKDRILSFLKSENKTSAQFAEEIGVQPSGISHILSGRNKPSLDFIMKMLETYPFLSIEWLLFGKGSMYREKTLTELFYNEGGSQPESQGTGEIPEKTEETAYEGNESPVSERVESRSTDHLKINRIVWFYTDNTFREFFPGNEN